MFKSLFGIIEDVATVVAAPVVIVADVTRAVTKPIADTAKEVVNEIKKELGND